MTTWFISRHQGAIDWIKQKQIQIDRFEAHLDVDQVQADDIVIGTLPIHLAAKVCEKGAKFIFLAVNISEQQRGTELSVIELNQQDCQLIPFYIQII
ncbi:CRISPR-associated protein Csx16 [Gallibacterium genomosp. 3]|uniref:CRISPR-associated protein n=1 Tax=Gallibacterium genomosp. 3 TaxID=505345 RepID=A0A1A7Q3C6_9PAST|nr:CRISPR-associated protein Csx16 [Gallibacterium genomosp. 3]OBX09338.1 CRISPR-associated protein [Gallibacterium genomosp. 3]